MKLDYRKTFLIGFGFFGLSIMWKLYNDYVPIFLQAGDPLFDAGLSAKTAGFGLNASWSGFIMTLDNLAALFLLPLIGVWSDRVWTRFGRRMPFILFFSPIAIVAFVLIPFAVRTISPELSGQFDALVGSFTFFTVSIAVFLLAMACFRTPVIALMPDLTPSPLRSQANGVINLMGGVGGVIAALVGAWLYGIDRVMPFVISGVLMAVAIAVLFFWIREPRQLAEGEEQGERLGMWAGVRALEGRRRTSLILLMLAIFCWFVGYNAVETFFTSYGVNVLNIQENTASLVSSISYLTFIAFAIPSGLIAARVGRRRTIIVGLVVFAALLVLCFFVPNLIVVSIALGLGGMGWALININSLPMVVDTAPTNISIGTYTGLYYLASQLAAIVGPILNGVIIDWAGRNYSMIFVVTPGFFVLAILCMMGVTYGEAKGQGTLSEAVELAAEADW